MTGKEQPGGQPPNRQIPAGALLALLEQAGRLIRFQNSLGVQEYPLTDELRTFLARKPGLTPPTPVVRAARQKTGQSVRQEKYPQNSPDIATFDPTALTGLMEEVNACRRCPRHRQGNNSPVPGRGQAGARLLIVGDSPSTEDALSSNPFSGEAGDLLDRMLAAIGMSRDNVYLSNLLKCHAPSESCPETGKDGDSCLPFLEREIMAVAPRVICSMGQLASQKLLHSTRPVSELRGRFHDFKGILLMPTFHPEFLLKNPEVKKLVWQDLQLIQKQCFPT